MALSGLELAKTSNGQTEIRLDPLRVRVEITELAMADGHAVTCGFGMAVRVREEHAELRMFRESFMDGRERVSAAEVAARFAAALRPVVEREVALTSANVLTGGDANGRLLELFQRRATEVAFHCGIEILPPFDLAFSSPSLHRDRVEAIERRAAERRTAGQLDHLRRAAELLKQFEAMRDSSSGQLAGRVLERLAPADRAEALEALFLAEAPSTPQETGQFCAVAGDVLLCVNPHDQKIKSHPLPTGAGPARCLRAAHIETLGDCWLVGARSGVNVVPRAETTASRVYLDPDGPASPLGFNAVAVRGDDLFASHGEAGIVHWRLDQPDVPIHVFRIEETGPSPRAIVPLGADELVYAAGKEFRRLAPPFERSETVIMAGASIVDVLAIGRRLVVVAADGEIFVLEADSLSTCLRQRCCGTVMAAALLPWAGAARVLLASEEGPLFCVGMDDSVVTQYRSGHRGLRAIAAGDGSIAAISPDRQRMVIWRAWEPNRPVHEMHMGHAAAHRLSDIAFTPAIEPR